MIAIIGILVALLLPAVQAAREAARRMSCSNNMKQIGLALHNYHDTYKTFPGSAIWGAPQNPPANPQAAYHHTWLTAILPFMEQQPLYDSVDHRLPAWGQAIVGTRVAGLECPSDAGSKEPSSNHGIALTNYAGSEGFHWWPTANFSTGPYIGEFTGVFTIEQFTRMADITDGTSNTIMAAEATSVGYKWGGFMTSGTGTRRKGGGEAVFRSAFVATGQSGRCCESGIYSEVDDSGTKTQGWFKAGPHSFSPTFLAAWGPNAEWPGASSFHPGVVLTALADGSVRSIPVIIEYGTWLRLNGRGDGSPVGDF